MSTVIDSIPLTTLGPPIVCRKDGTVNWEYTLPTALEYDIPGLMIFEDDLTEEEKYNFKQGREKAMIERTIVIEPGQMKNMLKIFLNDFFKK